MNTKLVIAASSVLWVGSAMAADIPARPAPPPVVTAPVVAPVYLFNWTGFYIGVHGGGDSFKKDWFAPNTPNNIALLCPAPCGVSLGSHKASSWLAGGQIGFNYQVGSWVWGIEAQASWSGLDGSNLEPVVFLLPALVGATNHTKTDALGTVAGRLGVAWDRTLLYVKGGGAWAHDKFRVTAPGCAPSDCAALTDNRWGWMGGVGAEYGLTGNWSLKVEYDYLAFGTHRETLAAVCAVCTAGDADVKQTIQLVKGGINYRFGGPVRAAY